jgi:hypothetical protein
VRNVLSPRSWNGGPSTKPTMRRSKRYRTRNHPPIPGAAFAPPRQRRPRTSNNNRLLSSQLSAGVTVRTRHRPSRMERSRLFSHARTMRRFRPTAVSMMLAASLSRPLRYLDVKMAKCIAMVTMVVATMALASASWAQKQRRWRCRQFRHQRQRRSSSSPKKWERITRQQMRAADHQETRRPRRVFRGRHPER